MPEVASDPVKVTLSGWLYQPFASGARAGVAVTCGPVSAGAADRGVRVGGGGVGRLRAGVDPGGGVGAGEGDRQRVVVPAVVIRRAGGASPGHLGRGRV